MLVPAKQALGIPLLQGCMQDPSTREDLNSLKQRIKVRSSFSATVSDMRVTVQVEWDRLQPADFNQYKDQMPERIAQLKQRKGM